MNVNFRTNILETEESVMIYFIYNEAGLINKSKEIKWWRNNNFFLLIISFNYSLKLRKCIVYNKIFFSNIFRLFCFEIDCDFFQRGFVIWETKSHKSILLIYFSINQNQFLFKRERKQYFPMLISLKHETLAISKEKIFNKNSDKKIHSILLTL